jgi:hypothetical protein
MEDEERLVPNFVNAQEPFFINSVNWLIVKGKGSVAILEFDF